MNTYLVPSSKIRIIDLKYFATYSPNAGFKVAIDGFHNMKDKGPFVTVYYVNHPEYNMDEVIRDPLRMQINSSFDWSSPLPSPAYIEGYVNYKKIKSHESAHLVIDVRKVKIIVKKGKEYYDLEPYAWCVLPLFTFDRYVNSGIYQMPLFKGAVSQPLLKRCLDSRDVWKQGMLDALRETDLETKKPLLEYMKYSSVIVRLIDGQREVDFSQAGSLPGTV